MPNVKIYVEDALFAEKRAGLAAQLLPMRDLLCARFQVDPPACQFAVLPVLAMFDLPLVNIEMHILPKPERTRDAVLSVCHALQAMLQEVMGVHAAIRVTQLDAFTYIALK